MLNLALKFFAILNPLGCLAQTVSLLRHLPQRRQRQVILREATIALAILLSVALGGDHLLGYLGVGIPALRLGGGCVLFLIAHAMLFPPERDSKTTSGAQKPSEPFVVPLAIPLIAGPGIIATLLVEAEHAPTFALLSALFLVWAISALILSFAPQIGSALGERGLEVLDRFVGLILLMISVNMMLMGLKGQITSS